MTLAEPFPAFISHMPDLDEFILELVQGYQAGEIQAWEDLEERAKLFFTAERMQSTESVVPGWRKMTSYSNGLTLTHVMCVFLGLAMLPEFRKLSQEQQELAKWIVLFHDVEKEIRKGERDPKHGFRSAVATARQLPELGFVVTETYDQRITPWSEYTYGAVRNAESHTEPVQDNSKLPQILDGIDGMFGEGTPAGLIVKTVLLHMSLDVVSDWPQAAPLTEAEIKRYLRPDLVPLLKVMTLADNEGWAMFREDREKQRSDTLKAFQKIEKLIFDGTVIP